MKENIAKWHRQGLWSKAQVQNACAKGLITAAEYQEITGEQYTPPPAKSDEKVTIDDVDNLITTKIEQISDKLSEVEIEVGKKVSYTSTGDIDLQNHDLINVAQIVSPGYGNGNKKGYLLFGDEIITVQNADFAVDYNLICDSDIKMSYSGQILELLGGGGDDDAITLGQLKEKFPPMYSGVEYKLGEQFFGHPVYARVIEFGPVPTEGTASVQIAPSGVFNVISICGIAQGVTEDTVSIPYMGADSGEEIRVWVQGRRVYLRTLSTRYGDSGFEAHILIKYLKNRM